MERPTKAIQQQNSCSIAVAGLWSSVLVSSLACAGVTLALCLRSQMTHGQVAAAHIISEDLVALFAWVTDSAVITGCLLEGVC